MKFSAIASFLVLVLSLGCTSIAPTNITIKEMEYTPTIAPHPLNSTKTLFPTNTAASPTIGTPTLTTNPTNSKTPFPTPTLPSECGTVKLGTPGTQKQNDPNAPSVLIEGTVVLCINRSLFSDDFTTIVPFREAMFDLDSGSLDIVSSDIGYEQSGTMDFNAVFPINGALAELWSVYIDGTQVKEPPQPTYDECKNQYIDPKRSDNEPSYLCVITNERHISRVKIERFIPIRSIPSVEISFITWNNVVVKP